jgi:cytoskeletal protein RodZ
MPGLSLQVILKIKYDMEKKTQLVYGIIIIIFLVVIVVVGVVWVFRQQINQGMIPTEKTSTQNSIAFPAVTRSISIEDVQRTSLEDAKTGFDNKEVLFVDVRSGPSYAVSHIPGAISIPEDQIIDRMNELDPNRWIITYCS